MMIQFINVFTFTQGFFNLIFRAVTGLRIFSFLITQVQNVREESRRILRSR